MLPSYEEVFSAITIPDGKLTRLEDENKRKLRIFYWIFAVSTLATIVSFIIMYVGYVAEEVLTIDLLFILFIIVWILSIVMLIYNTQKYKREYRIKFKKLVVGPFVQKLLELSQLPDETEEYEKYCHYEPEERISDEVIKASELFDTKIDEIHGEDYFQGKYGLTEFALSELKLIKEETSTDSDGHSSKTKVPIFDGVLFVADFKKDFSGLTVIERNLFTANRGIGKLAGKMFNGLGSTASKKANKKVKLESVEFNRLFTVETTDEIEARYILSATLMERLINFIENHKNHFTISFNHSTMFFAYTSKKNLFDDGIGKKNGHYDLKGIYNDLAFFLNIIEEFKLNTRIWSKS